MRFAFVAVVLAVSSISFVACSSGGGGRHGGGGTKKDLSVDLSEPPPEGADLKKVDQKGADLTTTGGGITVTSLAADPQSSLSEEPITFTAVVETTGGAEILGVILTDTNQTVNYGSMASTGFAGSYSLTLSWSAISSAQKLDFVGGATRTFKVVAATTDDQTAEKTITVSFSCNGVSACDGVCVDTDTSSQHCGGCDQPCSGSCSGGLCGGLGSATLSSCESVTSTSRTCNDVCSGAGGTCVAAGCGGVTAINYWDGTCGSEHGTSAGSCSTGFGSMFSGTISSDTIKCCCQ